MYFATYTDGSRNSRDRMSEDLKVLTDWITPLIEASFSDGNDPRASIYDLGAPEDKRLIIEFVSDTMEVSGVFEASSHFKFKKLKKAGINFLVDDYYKTAIIKKF